MKRLKAQEKLLIVIVNKDFIKTRNSSVDDVNLPVLIVNLRMNAIHII